MKRVIPQYDSFQTKTEKGGSAYQLIMYTFLQNVRLLPIAANHVENE